MEDYEMTKEQKDALVKAITELKEQSVKDVVELVSPILLLAMTSVGAENYITGTVIGENGEMYILTFEKAKQ